MRRVPGTVFLLVFVIWAGFAVAEGPTTPTKVSPEELFGEAQEAQKKGDYEAAVEKYQELIQIYPEVVAAHADLAVVLSLLSRYDEAITQYHIALAEAPGSAPLRLNLGLAYYKKGDFAGAAAQFASLHEATPRDVRVAVLLANCQMQLGLVEQAVAALQPLEAQNSENLDLEWALGTALLRTGKNLEGLRRIQKVADEAHTEDAYQLAANLNLRLTFFDQARRDAESILKMNPQAVNAHIVLGILSDYSGDSQTAVNEYQEALKSDPNNLQARVQLGSALLRLRRLDDARQQFERALTLDPNSSGARYELGQVEKAQGNLEAALKDFETAEQQDPSWLSPHVELVALYYRMKRPTDGAREKAIVDKLRIEDQKRRAETQVISPQLGPGSIPEPASLHSPSH